MHPAVEAGDRRPRAFRRRGQRIAGRRSSARLSPARGRARPPSSAFGCTSPLILRRPAAAGPRRMVQLAAAGLTRSSAPFETVVLSDEAEAATISIARPCNSVDCDVIASSRALAAFAPSRRTSALSDEAERCDSTRALARAHVRQRSRHDLRARLRRRPSRDRGPAHIRSRLFGGAEDNCAWG